MEKQDSDKEILVLNDEIEDDPDVVHDTYQNLQKLEFNHITLWFWDH